MALVTWVTRRFGSVRPSRQAKFLTFQCSCFDVSGIQDGNNSGAVLSHFSVQYEARYHCDEGHRSIQPISADSLTYRIVDRVIPEFVEALGRGHDRGVTLTEYFASLIPCGGGASAAVHRTLSTIPCQSGGCKFLAKPTDIGTRWPMTYIIMSDSRPSWNFPEEDRPAHIRFQQKFTVGNSVSYDLVSAIEYLPKGPHFVLRAIQEDGRILYYDDMMNNGVMIPMPEGAIVDECGTPGMSLYVFNRSSADDVVSSTHEALEFLFLISKTR